MQYLSASTEKGENKTNSPFNQANHHEKRKPQYRRGAYRACLALAKDTKTQCKSLIRSINQIHRNLFFSKNVNFDNYWITEISIITSLQKLNMKKTAHFNKIFE
jgi:hypothetical protein